MRNELTLAAVTDIHFGEDREAKRGSEALRLLDRFRSFVESERPDLVVDLGDHINEADKTQDFDRFRRVWRLLGDLPVPCHPVMGNHDLANLDMSDIESIVGRPLPHESLEQNGWRLIFWRADPTMRREGITFTEADFDWLDRELPRSSLPTVILTHVPLGTASMVGNYYFEPAPIYGAYANADRARRIISRSGNVVLVLSGHVHWNTVCTIDGVHYVTVQSLTETFTTHPYVASAWSTVRLGDMIDIEVHGRDPMRLSLPRKRQGHRWLVKPERPTMPPGPGEIAESLQGVRGIILDLDGVVYRGNQPIPGAKEFLEYLRSTGRRFVAVTNHSGITAEECAQKLQNMGIFVAPEEVMTSGWATARYLSETASDGATCFAVGGEVLITELERAGLTVTKPGTRADFVVVGYGREHARDRLTEATAHILAGARLIATNSDMHLPVPDGFELETGPTVAFLEAAGGRKAIVIGKPNATIVGYALSRLNVSKDETMIVGDTLETDIAAGIAAGIKTARVLTGNTGVVNGIDPTVTVRDLTELAALMAGATNRTDTGA